jgi:phosphoribosylanthranilate isomerase
MLIPPFLNVRNLTRSQVKICGLRDEANIKTAISRGADAIGFVFYPASPRHLDMQSFDKLWPMCAQNAPHIARVGVFVNPNVAHIKPFIESQSLTHVQVHKMATYDVANLKKHINVPLIYAHSIAQESDFALLDAYYPYVDAVLLDASAPKDSAIPGGNGICFDWLLLKKFAPPCPWGLAGGLNTQNIAQALSFSPDFVDISSGVEDRVGHKSSQKIIEFLEAVHSL